MAHQGTEADLHDYAHGVIDGHRACHPDATTFPDCNVCTAADAESVRVAVTDLIRRAVAITDRNPVSFAVE